MEDRIELKDYFEQVIELRFRALERQFAAFEKDLDRRLEGMNEVRAQMVAQKMQFVSREVYDIEHQKLRDQILGFKQYVLGIAAATALLGGILDFMLRSYLAMK